jgi:tetratricopeptide (TPR) repeat protein
MMVESFHRRRALSWPTAVISRVAGSPSNWKVRLAVVVLLATSVAGAQTPQEAQALEAQGKLAEAAQVWRAIIQKNPKDAIAFASLGLVLSRQEKYPDAADAYRKSLAINPNLPGVALNLGLAEFKQGHFEAAIDPLLKVLASDPSSMQAKALLGISYYGAQKFPQAIEYLKPVADADPNNTELHHMLAQSCLSAKQPCALDEFRKILEKNPDSAAAHMLYAQALDAQGKTDEAIQELEAGAKAAPNEPNLHFGLGYLYWKKRNFENAHREFEAELKLDAGHAQAMAYMGDTEMKLEHWESALAWLQKALQAKPDDTLANLDLGMVLSHSGRNEEALVALKRAVELNPEQLDAHYQLGRLYQQMGKRAEAQQEFAKARTLRQKNDEDLAPQLSSAPPSLTTP